MTKVNSSPRTDFSDFTNLELSFYVIQELRKRGYYVFIAEPKTDFNPDKFNPEAIDHVFGETFSDALFTLDAEPIFDDED